MPGERAETGPGTSASNPSIQHLVSASDDMESGAESEVQTISDEETVEDLKEDQGADDSDEEILGAMYDLLRISESNQ